MKNKTNAALQKGIAAGIAIWAALLLIAAAIAVPILVRPFYYLQIRTLNMVELTGYSEQVIRGAYDAVMDYLVKGAPFSTGQLACSPSARAHFEDCRTLFLLDFGVIGGSALLLIAFCAVRYVLRKKGRYQTEKHLPVFWAAIVSAGLFIILCVWGAVDFDALFLAFHRVFFPGKSNWVFDPWLDPIINILPERFFANCALLIAVLIALCDRIFLFVDARYRKRNIK